MNTVLLNSNLRSHHLQAVHLSLPKIQLRFHILCISPYAPLSKEEKHVCIKPPYFLTPLHYIRMTSELQLTEKEGCLHTASLICNVCSKAALVVYGQRAAFKYPGSRVQTRPKPTGFFRAKKSSARLPSEGKKSRGSHVADLRHVKDP